MFCFCLFRSCDGGQTFYTIMANNSNSIVSGVQGGAEPLCIRVNKKTGDLWCAGNCLGFSKLSAPYETKQTEAKHKYKIANFFNCSLNYLFGLDDFPDEIDFCKENIAPVFYERYSNILQIKNI